MEREASVLFLFVEYHMRHDHFDSLLHFSGLLLDALGQLAGHLVNLLVFVLLDLQRMGGWC